MAKERADIWTIEQDVYLAQTVIRCIKNGITQLDAFEAAGRDLGRSGAACGYRWNAVVRHRYKKEIEQAKMEHWHEMESNVAKLAKKEEDAEMTINKYERTFGSLIKRKRKELGITGKELASRAGIPASTLSPIENEGVKNPTTKTLDSLLGALYQEDGARTVEVIKEVPVIKEVEVIKEVGKERQPDNSVSIPASDEELGKHISSLIAMGMTVQVSRTHEDGTYRVDMFNPKK